MSVMGDARAVEQNSARPALGICLSGGGFRAALYSLGVMRYLAEAGTLRDVQVICGVSGGSVAAAAHLIGLIWAWSMFRAVGIEEDMREFANQGAALPYILTLITAAGFAVFGIYALAGAGDLRRPPLLPAGLACIAAIYIYRATWGTGAVADRDGAQIAFAVIALGVGLCYAYGAMPGVRSRATAAASTDRVL